MTKKIPFPLFILSMIVASQADVTISGLAENFEADSVGNTTTLWNNIGTGTLDLVPPNTASVKPGDTTLSTVTSAGTTITTAYSFIGTSGFGVDGANVFPSQDNSNSFELWIRPTRIGGTYAGTDHGMVIWESGGGIGLHFRIDEAGKIVFYAEGGEVSFDLTSLGVYQDGGALPGELTDFVQVVGTADGSDTASGTKLYVNGALVDEGAGKNWNGTGNRSGLAWTDQLGGYAWSDSKFYEGDMAVFRVYDDILTAQEVLDNYQALVPEPSAIALVMGGLLFTGLRRRRAER